MLILFSEHRSNVRYLYHSHEPKAQVFARDDRDLRLTCFHFFDLFLIILLQYRSS
jgi:hypothetical protein